MPVLQANPSDTETAARALSGQGTARVSGFPAGFDSSTDAARCAQDQGKFWEYHDLLFTQSPQLAPEDLRRYAGQVGVDVTKFDSCLAAGTHKAAVQRDLDEGNRLGVTGTPAFFINGRTLTGAQPLEAFTRLIEQELASATASRKGKE